MYMYMHSIYILYIYNIVNMHMPYVFVWVHMQGGYKHHKLRDALCKCAWRVHVYMIYIIHIYVYVYAQYIYIIYI